MFDDHIPVPAGHAPRLEARVDAGAAGLIVANPDRADEGAWIHAERPVEAER